MTDISQKTWKYLHGPDDLAHLSFKTGGVPRSFTAIQYTATERDEIDLQDDGIAIIDNDQMSVVLDGHLKNNPDAQASFMSDLRKMSWAHFRTMALKHPRYRGSQTDFHRDTPNKGVLVNQIQRGVMHAPSDEADLRSPSMVLAHASSECPYSFPRMTRSEALQDLLSHDCLKGEDGRWRLSWALPSRSDHPYFKPSASDLDDPWQKHCEAHPELFDLAAQSLLERYFSGGVTTWPESDDGRYAFCSGGLSNPDVICLESIDGAEIDFASRGEFGALLDALPDTALRDIWKLQQVTDHNLAPEVVRNRITAELEPIRNEVLSPQDPDLMVQADL